MTLYEITLKQYYETEFEHPNLVKTQNMYEYLLLQKFRNN